LGLAVDEDLSPAVMRKAVPLATKLPSFASAADSVAETLEFALTIKRVERLTERIGRERLTEREAAVAAWEALPLVAKQTAPPGVKPPAKVCVSCDGGRMQRRDLPPEAKSHWCETKVGICLELEGGSHTDDPCPAVPDKFLDLVQMEQVTREIKRSVAKGSPFARPDAAAENAAGATAQVVAAAREPVVAEPPKVTGRDVVASLAPGELFGRQLAAHAWSLGFAAAPAKAFIADGSSTNWGIWQRHFKPLRYVPILDFIHALTYIFSAAMAGWPRPEAAAVYVRWITWVWRGEVVRVIAELAARAAELGAPEPESGDTDPRVILAETLTYLTNQQSRMNDPQYRRDGLPITSSHIESTVKQINHRVKGSEKFWTAAGGEALLQLRADLLSDTAPLDRFWSRRAQQSTGTRTYHRTRTAA
jgi:hypothetical protein